MKDFYGPQYDIQNIYPHQGYGSTENLNYMFKALPPSQYNHRMKYFLGDGVTAIDLPNSVTPNILYNCTPGFLLMNSSLIDKKSQIVYTDPTKDTEGGYDIEKCPTYDNELNCYVDITYQLHMKGDCCYIEPETQRAIYLADDQFYHGTCEADTICSSKSSSEATPCRNGFMCDVNSTEETSVKFKCAAGYNCADGTTPDPGLDSTQGQYKILCNEKYYCSNAEIKKCPKDHFCPAGGFDKIMLFCLLTSLSLTN